MNMLSRNLIATLAIVTAPWLAAPAHAVTIASPLMLKNATSSVTETVQYRRGWRGGGGGAAVGLGIAGALIGGAIIGATQQPYGYYGYGPGYYGPAYVVPAPYVGGDAVSYCAQRFRSYDPYSGTYVGYDGFRHPCP
jgi:hypothetical protein